MFQCTKCSTSWDSAKRFQKHFLTHLDPEQANEQNIDVSEHAVVKYQCKECDKTFDEHEIKKHKRWHNMNLKIFKVCDLCGKVFTTRRYWFNHMLGHETEKSGNYFVCKICGNMFKTPRLLKQHLTWHSKKRPHVCEVCGKTFKRLAHLHRHRHIHNDVKPLSCDFCGKGFASEYNLKGHLRTHTGEKPYQCDVCNAAFTHNVSLKTHKRSAHGIDMWKDQKPTPSAKECEDLDMNNPELYKIRLLDDTIEGNEKKPLDSQSTQTLPVTSSKSSDCTVQPKTEGQKVSGSSSNTGSSAPRINKADLGTSSRLLPTGSVHSGNEGQFVSIPLRAPDPSRVMPIASLSSIPNFMPIAINLGVQLPGQHYLDSVDNHQSVQPPLAHSTYHSSAHGSAQSSVSGSAHGSVFDSVGFESNAGTSSQPPRTLNRWTNEAPGRRFTDL